jgi:hypothetical protein
MINIPNSIKHLSLATILLLAPFSAFALDIIYLKNESIIKGTIIENNVAEKKYKIKTSDGSIFVYTSEEITKITKDESAAAPQTTPSIVINNTNTNNNQDTVTNNNAPTLTTTPEREAKKWKLFFGSLRMTESIDLDCACYTDDKPELAESQYSGSTFGISYALKKKMFLRASKITATFDETEFKGYWKDYSTYKPGYTVSDLDISYDAVALEILFASNSWYTDWNGYVGLGYISETFTPNEDISYYNSNGTKVGVAKEVSDAGLLLSLGGEYNFDSLALGINISIMPATETISYSTSDNLDVTRIHSSLYLALRL